MSAVHRLYGTRRTSTLTTFAGLALIAVGTTGAATGLGSAASGTSGTQVVDLANVDAATGEPCPDIADPSWFFEVEPADGTFTIERIELNVSGTNHAWARNEMILDPERSDAAWIPVPDGFDLWSLRAAGSVAEVAPLYGQPQFVLSHICIGDGDPPTTTTTTSTTTTTISTTAPPPTTTSTTTAPPTTSTTAPPTTTTSTTTSTPVTTTSTTLPCRYDGRLSADDDRCVPALAISTVCFDLDHTGTVERYWHRLTNDEATAVNVTWADGSARLRGGRSLVVSSVSDTIIVEVDGRVAASTTARSVEFCQNDIKVTKVVDGPADAERVYTIQVSRLVDGEYEPEGEMFQLRGGESRRIPLPSTFNDPGVNYKITEIDAGGADAVSITPDSFVLDGHRGKTIGVTIRNGFAAISLDKSVDATTVQPGQELRYTLVAENTGALPLDPVVIIDRLPAEVTYVDGNYDIVGDAGTCTLLKTRRPQLIRCDLTGRYEPGERTPAVELLVRVDPDLTGADTIVNQAQASGSYDGSVVRTKTLTSGGAGRGASDLSCSPTNGHVCDLSAAVGTTMTQASPTAVAPTTATDATPTAATPAATLPRTGSGSSRLLVLVGAASILLGGLLLLGARRPAL